MASGKSIGKHEGQKAETMIPSSSHAGHPIQGRTAHVAGGKGKGK